MSDMEPETAERIIAGTIAYYRGCSDKVIARQVWIALKAHHRNKHSDDRLPGDCTPEEIAAHERRVKQIIRSSYPTKTPETKVEHGN